MDIKLFAADIVTKNNAQEVASEALSNSGGNPDLQNFGKVIDKGDYFEIKAIIKQMLV